MLRDTLVLIDNRCYQDEWVIDTGAVRVGGADDCEYYGGKDEKAK